MQSRVGAAGRRSWGRAIATTACVRRGALLAVLALGATVAPAAAGQAGRTVPGAVVTAVNPGTSGQGGDFFLSLTAHSAKSSATAPSCRPQDTTLRCFGSLELRIAIPEMGGDVTLAGLEVHRVAVGDTSCGGCEGDETTEAAVGPAGPTRDESDEAAVNGLSTVTRGTPELPTGTTVQVRIVLVENGRAPYSGEAGITVAELGEGSNGPEIADTGEVPIEHVAIHLLGPGS